MYLHEAIEKVLKEKNRPMTSREIADAVNAAKLYTRADGTLLPSSQISARVNNYPLIFTKKEGKISLK